MLTKKKAPSERELFVGCKSLVVRVSIFLLVAVIVVFNLFPFVCALVASFPAQPRSFLDQSLAEGA
jgi:hypothetical protein